MTRMARCTIRKERGSSFNESKKAECAVKIYSNGEIRIVILDAATGEVLRVKSGDPVEAPPRR